MGVIPSEKGMGRGLGHLLPASNSWASYSFPVFRLNASPARTSITRANQRHGWVLTHEWRHGHLPQRWPQVRQEGAITVNLLITQQVTSHGTRKSPSCPGKKWHLKCGAGPSQLNADRKGIPPIPKSRSLPSAVRRMAGLAPPPPGHRGMQPTAREPCLHSRTHGPKPTQAAHRSQRLAGRTSKLLWTRCMAWPWGQEGGRSSGLRREGPPMLPREGPVSTQQTQAWAPTLPAHCLLKARGLGTLMTSKSQSGGSLEAHTHEDTHTQPEGQLLFTTGTLPQQALVRKSHQWPKER